MIERQSFAQWQVPSELDGVLYFEDFADPKGGARALKEGHFHDELELHFFERGEGLILLADQRLPVRAGSMLWIPPGCKHLWLELSPDCRRWLLLCRTRLIRRVLPPSTQPLILGKSAREHIRTLAPRNALSLSRTLHDARPPHGAARSIWNASIAFALARCFSHYEIASAAESESPKFHLAVSRALALLREGTRSLPELAHETGLSESHLSKLFSAQVGVSVTDFRNRVALDRFLSLYGDGRGPSMLQTALDAGFGSYPNFHRVFRKQFGYPPAEHRRLNKTR